MHSFHVAPFHRRNRDDPRKVCLAADCGFPPLSFPLFSGLLLSLSFSLQLLLLLTQRPGGIFSAATVVMKSDNFPALWINITVKTDLVYSSSAVGTGCAQPARIGWRSCAFREQNALTCNRSHLDDYFNPNQDFSLTLTVCFCP